MRVGVMDTGIDFNHPDLAGAVVHDPTVPRQNRFHGTGVAGIIGARKNGIGIHGVAYNATLVDLVMGHGGHLSGVTGRVPGFEWARSDVVNMSFKFGAENPGFRSAMHNAAQAGVIMVIAAGNDGQSQPAVPAKYVTDPGIAGLGIVVGALNPHNPSSAPRSSFSNDCGAALLYCIYAPGQNVTTTMPGGRYGGFGGTSAAAPYVSGAVALALAAFPTRTPRQIVERILSTADDLGAPGIDAIYGRGALNVGRALSPVGQLSVPTDAGADHQTSRVATLGTLQQSSAFGTMRNVEQLRSVLTYDEQRFPFLLDLSKRLGGAAAAQSVQTFLARRPQQSQRQSFAGDQWGLATSLTFGFAESGASQSLGSAHSMPSMFNAAETPVAMAETAAPFQSMMGRHHAVGLAITLSETLKLSFSAATNSLSALAGNSSNVGYGFQAAAPRAASETGKTLARLGLTHEGGGLGTMMVSAGMMAEQNGLLDSFGTGSLSMARSSRSAFVQVGLRYPLGDRVDLLARYTHGWADADDNRSSLWSGLTGLSYNAYMVGASYRGLFGADDKLTLMVGQPLRLTSGQAMLRVPTGETKDGKVVMSDSRVDLAPADRELLIQLGYQATIMEVAKLSLGTFLRLNPGHDATRERDMGAGVKLVVPF